jgi:hypothetical protein
MVGLMWSLGLRINSHHLYSQKEQGAQYEFDIFARCLETQLLLAKG